MLSNDHFRAAMAILRDRARDPKTMQISAGGDAVSSYEGWDNGEVEVRPYVVSGKATYMVDTSYQANDCDGPFSSYATEEATVTFTRNPKKTGRVLIPKISYRTLKKRQRDVFAEAAGY